MPQQYDPLSQEEDDVLIRDAEPDNGDSSHTELLPRPAIYYGEGPFNAPSSDEEEEVEKVGTGPLDRAEHGSLLGSGLADSGLYVGGRKVSTGYAHEVARVNNDILIASSAPPPLSPAGISICPGTPPRASRAFDPVGSDRTLCGLDLQRSQARRTRKRAHNVGSRLQRHICRLANGALLGSRRCATKVGHPCDCGANSGLLTPPFTQKPEMVSILSISMVSSS